jgi:cytochrome P450
MCSVSSGHCLFKYATLTIIGGHHSIGPNITWTLIELQRHPEYYTKLMEEIENFDDIDFDIVKT